MRVWPNPAPLGYHNRRESGKSSIVPDPGKVHLVVGLFERSAEGMSILDITKWARSAGLRGKRGGQAQESTVHWILRNPIHAGEFWWDGTLYKSQDPALIPMHLFERVQAKLDGFHDTRVKSHDFAFAGLIRCAHCGYAVTAEIQKKKYIYYHCSKNCQKERFVREEKLVELFGQVLRELVLGPEALEIAKGGLLHARRDIKAGVETRLAAARARYDRLGALIDKAYEDKLMGCIDEDSLQRKRRTRSGPRPWTWSAAWTGPTAGTSISASRCSNSQMRPTSFTLAKSPTSSAACSIVRVRTVNPAVEARDRAAKALLLPPPPDGEQRTHETAPSGIPKGAVRDEWAILDSNQ